MIEKIEKVNVVRVKAMCECGKQMFRTNGMLLSFPPQYEYHCVCGNKERSSESYPLIRYEEQKEIKLNGVDEECYSW